MHNCKNTCTYQPEKKGASTRQSQVVPKNVVEEQIEGMNEVFYVLENIDNPSFVGENISFSLRCHSQTACTALAEIKTMRHFSR